MMRSWRIGGPSGAGADVGRAAPLAAEADPERQLADDAIVEDRGAVRRGLEAVPVHPAVERTAHLKVAEPGTRLDLLVLGGPGDVEGADPEAQTDPAAGAEGGVARAGCGGEPGRAQAR